MSKIREFLASLPPAGLAPAPPPGGAGNPQKPVPNQAAPQTDNKGLGTTEETYISDDGGSTSTHHFQADVEYWFYANFKNASTLPSDPCFVKFVVSDGMDWEDIVEYKKGIKPQEKIKPLVKFGTFPDTEGARYEVQACIYLEDDPDKSIACAGKHGVILT